MRRTPVILDGVVVTAAAMLAEELAPGARRWWVAGHRSAEPAHTLALEHLELERVLVCGLAGQPILPLPSFTMLVAVLKAQDIFEKVA